MSVFNIKPSPLTGSTREFLIPPTILSDYENYLMTEVPNAVYDFELLHDWCAWYDKDREKYMLRAENFPINWKSKVGNSDLNFNFFTDTHQDIRKGDIVIREDGTIMMLNWDIQIYINAKTTQSIECNHWLEVVRHVPAKADKRGMMMIPAHDEQIVRATPCVMSEYAGRPDFMVSQNAPGIHADMLTVCEVQYNEETAKIDEMDTFAYGNYTYRVIHIDQSQIMKLGKVDENGDIISVPYGVVKLYVRKVAGENQ